jgi:hypothetical protein
MSVATTFVDTRCIISATIPNGTATTAEIDLGGTNLLGIQFPAAMTQTTMKIQYATASGGTYQTVQDTSASDIQFTFTQGKCMMLTAIQQAQLVGLRFIKLVVGGNEGADRVLSVIAKPVS